MLAAHQVSAIERMRVVEAQSDSQVQIRSSKLFYCLGLLRDPVGSGKTRSVVEFCKSSLDVHQVQQWRATSQRQLRYSDHFTETVDVNKKFGNMLRGSVVVAGLSNIFQWEAELKTAGVEKDSIVVRTTKSLEAFREKKGDFAIVVVSCTFYARLQRIARADDMCFQRVFYDDCRSLHIPGYVPIVARFWWLIDAIQGNEADATRFPCCTMLKRRDVAPCELLPHITVHTPEELIIFNASVLRHDVLVRPVSSMVGAMMSLGLPTNINVLLQVGDVAKAAVELGGTATMSFDEVVQSCFKKQLALVDNAIHRLELRQMPVTERLANERKKLLSRLDHITKNSSEILKLPCMICHDDITNPVVATCCQNVTCSECILSWRVKTKTCPFCRAQGSEIVPFRVDGPESTDPEPASPDAPELKTALEALQEIVMNHSSVLVYSEAMGMSAQIADLCASLGKTCVTDLYGHCVTRQRAIGSFRDGKIDVIVMDANWDYAGIDLPTVDAIVLYHEIQSQHKNMQIIGRGRRLGRTKPLHVYQFRCKA